ncbi:MAG: hypothetical protein AB9866_16455 [Syntrophobacteraceae bacterium]
MATLEHLDLVLGEALEGIVEASNEVRGIDIVDAKEALKHLGKAVSELWHVRETIYSLKPELKRYFVQEHEEDKVRYEELSMLRERAHQAEENSDFDAAARIYEELRQTSRFGYFRMIAEAGLYRVSRSLCHSPHSDVTSRKQGSEKGE